MKRRTFLLSLTAAGVAGAQLAPTAAMADPGVFDSLTLLSSTDPLADTSRLRITSHQKQERSNSWNGGESVWLDVSPRAKSMVTWRLAVDPNDWRKAYPLALGTPPDSAYRRVVWMGAHWFAQDKAADDTDESTAIHGHWSVETPDVDGSLRTRFQIFFNDQLDSTKIGSSAALISTNRADFRVVRGTGLDGVTPFGRFVLQGGGAYDKMVEFSRSSADSGTRWKIGTNAAAESGASGTGSDFELQRYSNSGALVETSLSVRRLDGSVLVGGGAWGAGADAARLSVIHGQGTSGILVRPPAAAMNDSAAAYKAVMLSDNDLVLAAHSGTGTAPRIAIRAGGSIEWGTGSKVDTRLYRSAAGRIETDGELSVAANLRLGGMTVGNSKGIVGIANTTTVSASIPSRGVWLYAEAGVLKVRGSGSGGKTLQLAQQPAIANATSTNVVDRLNSVLTALRTIGFIASWPSGFV